MAENYLNAKCIVIGGSAGSLKIVLNALPAIATTVPIIVVLHRKSNVDGTLEDLMNARTHSLVKEVEDKEPLMPSCIYLAPPNYHLLLEKDGTCSLDASEKINYSRPSIDATFQTAAEAYGPNLMAILLSGANADGSEGMQEIHAHGGVIVVQDPLNATVPFMPDSAIAVVPVDHIILDTELAATINNFK